MSAFHLAEFEGHSSVQPKVLDFLSHNAAPGEMVEALKSLVHQVQSSIATTHALANQAKTTADRALSAAGNHCGGRGGCGRGGHGSCGGRGGPGAGGRGDQDSAHADGDHE